MDIKEKVWFILNKYNNGELTNYAENMLNAIDQFDAGHKEYECSFDWIIRTQQLPFPLNSMQLTWKLSDLLGECILNNNANFFNE